MNLYGNEFNGVAPNGEHRIHPVGGVNDLRQKFSCRYDAQTASPPKPKIPVSQVDAPPPFVQMPRRFSQKPDITLLSGQKRIPKEANPPLTGVAHSPKSKFGLAG